MAMFSRVLIAILLSLLSRSALERLQRLQSLSERGVGVVVRGVPIKRCTSAS